VFLVDGELATADWLQEVGGLDAVYALQVACWNPRDSTLSRSVPGIPVYEVVTKTFVEKITSSLVQIEQSQRALLERRGSFSADLAELGLAHLQADGVKIVLTVDSGGWTATATRELMAHRCSVARGAATLREPEGDDRTPRCFFEMARKVALPRP
jgi:hypothetical protein